jgi:hypothetical protein
MDSHTNGKLIGNSVRSVHKEKGKYSEAMEGKNMQISQIHPIARRQKEKDESDRKLTVNR